MIDFVDILKMMRDMVKGTVSDHVFLQDRPSSVEVSMDDFVVVSLPVQINETEIGQDDEYGHYWTTARFEIFIRDKATASNPNAVSINAVNEKVKILKRLFPAKKNGILIQKPKILIPSSSDGEGFHYTIIQARLEYGI